MAVCLADWLGSMIWFRRMAFCGFYEGRSQRLQPCNFINIKCWAIHFELQVRPRSANGSRTARDQCNALTIDVHDWIKLCAEMEFWALYSTGGSPHKLGGYEEDGGQDSSDTSCNTSTAATDAVRDLRHATVASIDCSWGGQKSHRIREAETCTCTAIQLWTVHSEASDWSKGGWRKPSCGR